ncbi:olfactory receptor 10AG1-like [Ornithorhynchus anatinus]|uniref:olfactory receptor 10AG1-like n=1 Tax=Ornithorhynchus anatinus TaxID=9258 RepID=UPI0019D44F2C|nr:olfactory receptor 10AG1-like [Ornithorhynchus anatinus]
MVNTTEKFTCLLKDCSPLVDLKDSEKSQTGTDHFGTETCLRTLRSHCQEATNQYGPTAIAKVRDQLADTEISLLSDHKLVWTIAHHPLQIHVPKSRRLPELLGLIDQQSKPPDSERNPSFLLIEMKLTRQNHTTVTEFVLMGFTNAPKLQTFLFATFLVIYMMILMGNSLIILITKTDRALHTPMYFFLRNLSFLEVGYTSVTLPRMLANLWTQTRTIPLVACAAQMYFFLMFGATECFLLAVMAYDRYVAICSPRQYSIIMDDKACLKMAAGSWISGIPVQLGQTYQIFSLPFCDSNKLNHFFCDIPPVLELACGDTAMNELSVYAVALLLVTAPFLLILVSYVKIISIILKLPSAMGKRRVFSTCSSHLIVVTSFFGSAIITYLRPKSSHSVHVDKFLSLFYTTVTPMFNPMIYSLRKKEVTVALKKFLSQLF